jgi:hypothetical protein
MGSSEEGGRSSCFDGVKKREEVSAAHPCPGEKVRRKGGPGGMPCSRHRPGRGGGAARSAQK